VPSSISGQPTPGGKAESGLPALGSPPPSFAAILGLPISEVAGPRAVLGWYQYQDDVLVIAFADDRAIAALCPYRLFAELGGGAAFSLEPAAAPPAATKVFYGDGGWIIALTTCPRDLLVGLTQEALQGQAQ
jgi:hypothetical protein